MKGKPVKIMELLNRRLFKVSFNPLDHVEIKVVNIFTALVEIIRNINRKLEGPRLEFFIALYKRAVKSPRFSSQF